MQCAVTTTAAAAAATVIVVAVVFLVFFHRLLVRNYDGLIYVGFLWLFDGASINFCLRHTFRSLC